MTNIHKLSIITLVTFIALLTTGCGSGGVVADSTVPDSTVPDNTVPDLKTYSVILSGQNEVPANASTANGSGSISVDSTKGTVSGTFTFSGFTATKGHIHTAFAGSNGESLITLELNPDTKTFSIPANTVLDAAGLASLAKGELYINLHSEAFESGELRGQIAPSDISVFKIALTGTEEVPSVTTSATGTAFLTVNTVTGSLVGTIETNSIVPTKGHIHTGLLGSNGPSLITLELDSNTNNFVISDNIVLDAAGLASLAKGELYINLHSEAFESGELRGQIAPSDISVFKIALTGTEEVPSVTTSATGTAFLTVNTVTGSLVGTIETNSIVPTKGHIHTGLLGSNGPSLITLELDSNTNNFVISDNTVLDAAGLASLAKGELYINLHSEAFESGELRGQIAPSDISVFKIALTGTEEVPSVTTSATGTAFLTVNTVTGSLVGSIETNSIVPTKGHIHTGLLGSNGPSLITLELDSNTNNFVISDNTVLDAAGLASLAKGELYINLHSEAFESGELRGQIAPSDISVFKIALTGTEEVPSVTTSATGTAFLTVNTVTGSLVGSIETNSIVPTKGHIHTGLLGSNGPSLITLELDSNTNNFVISDNTVLDAAGLASLAKGELYINLHSEAFESGELRGQIAPSDISVFKIALTGTEEVPSVTTSATGTAFLTVNTVTGSLVGTIETNSIVPTKGHIHTGLLGSNGPSLITLELDSNTNNFVISDNIVLDAAGLASLAKGELYINLHSEAFESGELRGQIVLKMEFLEIAAAQ